MLWTDKAKKLLLKYWGYDSLKDKQITIINEILSGHDVIGLLPTGYGKSLCYILPPLLVKKTIFIISPLISLMDDQKDKLINMGIKVSAMHCNNPNRIEETKLILDNKIKIVFMSPEYLIEGNGLKLAEQLIELDQLRFLAIDESHCVSQWGHDFRSAYLKIYEFRKLFPLIPIMAVTATAKKNVIEEIINALKLKHPLIVRANFDRPNLMISCEYVPKIRTKINYELILNKYINKYENDRIIIYVNTRKDTESLSTKINTIKKKKISSAYHAGLSKNQRENVQNDFVSKKYNIIVSTIAFGMGIDQIVRCVIIIGCPSSIEEYWQQIGRGGRDGEYSETVLYLDEAKKFTQLYLINKSESSKEIKQHKRNNIANILELVNFNLCKRHYILNYLGLCENYFSNNGFTCQMCDNCINDELIDITHNIWSHYINGGKIPKYIKTTINDLKLNNILIEWVSHIKENKYTLLTLPENLKIKIKSSLLLKDNLMDNLFDQYEKMII